MRESIGGAWLFGIVIVLPFFLSIKGVEVSDKVIDLLSTPLGYYFYSLYGMPLVYCLLCLIDNHDEETKNAFKLKYIILNIIDAVLAYISLAFFPWPLAALLYDKNKWYYYSIGVVFSFFPLVIEYVHKKKVESPLTSKIITRLLMVLTIGFVCFILTSCESLMAI